MLTRYVVLGLGIVTTLAMASGGRPPQPVEPAGQGHGRVVVLSRYVQGGRGTEIVVALDERAPSATRTDGRIDHVFRLQARGTTINPIALQWEEADVSWNPSQLEINVHGKTLLSLVHENVDAGHAARVLQGFGLSHSRLPGGYRLQEGEITAADFQGLQAKLFTPCPSASAPEGGCKTGGEGRQTCKLEGEKRCTGVGTECGVTCGPTTYSCCWCENTEEHHGACCKCIPVS